MTSVLISNYLEEAFMYFGSSMWVGKMYYSQVFTKLQKLRLSKLQSYIAFCLQIAKQGSMLQVVSGLGIQ
jgi:hypothetical protein